ncbi:MAG: bifunctional riboflavin kinase/FAD synthetase [Clostridia bacterium]|nr:bifunctional riboflavin kinase/FAD synthetase [Clostridia bacterium]
MNGFYNVLKPTGYTSSDVVIKLRGIIRAQTGLKVKCGHLGTLDPGGSGVLPIAVGVATKLFDELGGSKKIYRAQATLGVETDTLDSYGNVLREIDTKDIPVLSEEKIIEVFKSFIGVQEQLPPKYSAKSIDGKRAYDLARKGVDFEVKTQKIEIFDVKLLSYEENRITFDLTCSGGTYVRSFVRDLGEKLGAPAYMSYIIRLKSAGFDIENAVTLEEIESDLNSGFISLENYAKTLPSININDHKKEFGVGGEIPCEYEGLVGIYADRFIGIGKGEEGFLKRAAIPDEEVLNVEEFDKTIFPQKISLALGYFDAMHLGHAKIIKELKSTHGIPAIFTLKGSINDYNKNYGDLYSFEDRTNSYFSAGVKKIFYEEVTEDFMNTEPKDFLDLLTENINVGAFVCGGDYTFGKKASGDVEFLRAYAGSKGIELKVVDILTIDGEKISSRSIKEAIKSGDVEKANSLLGYVYSVRGKVVSGRKEGRRIGYPTVNVNLDRSLVTLKEGVYHTKTRIKGEYYDCVTNVGAHPTFEDENFNAETHIIGYEGDLYGKTIKIEFIKYLRGIKKFTSAAELKKQIAKDIEEIKK